MYSKNQLLYKTGLKRAWISWAKSENGRENAMVRHNLYNLAAYLYQEFWVVFLPLPPLSPPLPPPHPLPWSYFSIKDRLVHVAEVINPFYLRESFDDTLTSVICRAFMTSRGSITHDLMCDRQLNTVSPGFCSELPLENTYWLGSRQIAKENQRNTGEDNWDRRNKEVTVRGWKTGWRECRGDALLPHHLNYSVV